MVEDNPEAHPDNTEVGTFATGQDDRETYPEDANVGTFADDDQRFDRVS
ncbi:MAG: hypothetical protein ACLP01_09680 [Solirubrobacteraceae bacterium]